MKSFWARVFLFIVLAFFAIPSTGLGAEDLSDEEYEQVLHKNGWKQDPVEFVATGLKFRLGPEWGDAGTQVALSWEQQYLFDDFGPMIGFTVATGGFNEKSNAFDLSVGLRKWFAGESSLVTQVGAGLSYGWANLGKDETRMDTSGTHSDRHWDSDSALGYWAGGGIYDLSENRSLVGVEAGISYLPLELLGDSINAWSFSLMLRLGWNDAFQACMLGVTCLSLGHPSDGDEIIEH
jgi:hypothetical protein